MKKLTILRKNYKHILICLLVLTYFSCEIEDDGNVVEETITEEGENGTEEEVPTAPAEEPAPPTEEPTQRTIPTEEPAPPTEEPTQPTEEPTAPTEEAIAENLTDAEALLILVNQSRAEEGLPSLVLNDALNRAALAHSADMEANDYFSHTGLNGSRFSTRSKDAGYTGSPRGENIAVGQRSVEAVHSAWMNSEGHRRNILNSSITEMGLGHSGRYWTQIFGTTR